MTTEEAPKERPRKLPLLSEPILTQLSAYVPDFLADLFRDRQRKLMAVERRVQRRFLNEYRAQVRSYEPVLRDRGLFIGQSIIDAFTGGHTTETKYAEAENSTRENSSAFFQQANVMEMMQTLDPIIAPVLDPFVEGLKQPINAQLAEVESGLKKGVAAVAVASLLAGFVLGRTLPGRSGGGGKGSKR